MAITAALLMQLTRPLGKSIPTCEKIYYAAKFRRLVRVQRKLPGPQLNNAIMSLYD
jgi:hypothetical protein